MKRIKMAVLSNILIWLPLLIGGLLTTLIAILLHAQNRQEDKVHIASIAQQAETLISEHFARYEYGLRGARGAVIAVEPNNITRNQFEQYIGTRDIPKEFPGALGFGYIRRVPLANEAKFVDAARADGAPNFTIRTLTPHSDDRFVIQYIYPIEPNKQAVGLDIGSEKNRRSAAISAARENRAFLTEPITLVQADKKARRGVLILLPVFPPDITLNTPDLREQHVVGWSYAPLIIDDVLANLGQIATESQIRLHNRNEPTPFFTSKTPLNSLHPEDTIWRQIEVMGQTWDLEVTPTDTAYALHRWDLRWILGIGLGVTFLLVLTISLLSAKLDSNKGASSESLKGRESVILFVKSSVVRKTWPPAMVVVLIIFLLVSWILLEKEKSEVSRELQLVNNRTQTLFDDVAKQYRRDVLFMANTPPIDAIKSLQKYGANGDDNSTETQWKSRLADIFKAYMLTAGDVFQVRLITAQSHWKEQVKVERDGLELREFDDASLQDKSDEPYIRKTMNTSSFNVHISNINLNREHGEIEKPERPVWRFSTPIFYDDGTPFGLIIINLNASSILSKIQSRDGDKVLNYLTNQDGTYILNPDISKSFAFESHTPLTWPDDFQLAPSTLLAIDGIAEFNGKTDDVWALHSMFMLEDSTSPRFINIYSVTAKTPRLLQLMWQLIVVAVIMMCMVLFSAAIQYWVWLNTLVAEKDRWHEQLQHQQRKELARFKALLESYPEAMLIVDGQGIVKMVNAEVETLFELSRAQMENHSIAQLIPENFRTHHRQNVANYVRAPQNRKMGADRQLLALRGNGEAFPVEISLSGVALDDELLVSVSVRDITERLANEKTLRHALQEAENATQAKSAFLANTSHEIRTPLNAIIGLTHLLKDESLSEHQRGLIEKIHLSGKSLLNIVNDVLDLSKIEANKMTLELLPVDLRNMLDEVASVFEVQAEQKKLMFEVTFAPNLPRRVEGDAVRLKQIVTNLLSNAFKFTQTGRITLSAVLKDSHTEDNTKCVVRFSIQDTGLGISELAQQKLFKPFSQADVSTTRRFGGTGLGLSIVNRLVQLMEGSIGINSKEGEGSTFWFDVPFTLVSEDSIALEEINNKTSIYLVMAEDDKDDAAHLVALASSLGWRCDIVSDGHELISLIASRHDKGLRLPDALIVDWQMPNIDGIEAIEMLAARFGREHLPAVLMVSAFEKSKIKSLDTQSLIDAILEKPVTASGIFNAVNDVVCRHTGNTEKVLASTLTERVNVKWLAEAKILVVDDSDTNLEVASYLLTQAGANVTTASSAVVALNILGQSPCSFDAVLMDVQMPEMDGLDATHYIRQTLHLSDLPVIALTAGALVEEKKRALAIGMNDFLTKPISPAQLISVLHKQITHFTGKSVNVKEPNSAPVSTDDWPQIEGLDSTQAKELLMNNQTLFFNTLKRLLVDNENLMDTAVDVDQPAQLNVRKNLAAQVHKLRSASGMVGAVQIHSLASTAEELLRKPNTKANEILKSLAHKLLELRLASKAAILAWEEAITENDDSNIELTGNSKVPLETAEKLLSLLKSQDLAVLSMAEDEKAYLLTLLGRDAYNLLLSAVQQLNFKDAKQLLAEKMANIGGLDG